MIMMMIPTNKKNRKERKIGRGIGRKTLEMKETRMKGKRNIRITGNMIIIIPVLMIFSNSSDLHLSLSKRQKNKNA